MGISMLIRLQVSNSWDRFSPLWWLRRWLGIHWFSVKNKLFIMEILIKARTDLLSNNIIIHSYHRMDLSTDLYISNPTKSVLFHLLSITSSHLFQMIHKIAWNYLVEILNWSLKIHKLTKKEVENNKTKYSLRCLVKRTKLTLRILEIYSTANF
jgi:hypothetical protein